MVFMTAVFDWPTVADGRMHRDCRALTTCSVDGRLDTESNQRLKDRQRSAKPPGMDRNGDPQPVGGQHNGRDGRVFDLALDDDDRWIVACELKALAWTREDDAGTAPGSWYGERGRRWPRRGLRRLSRRLGLGSGRRALRRAPNGRRR